MEITMKKAAFVLLAIVAVAQFGSAIIGGVAAADKVASLNQTRTAMIEAAANN